MSEPPGWYRAPTGWAVDGAPEPPAVEPTSHEMHTDESAMIDTIRATALRFDADPTGAAQDIGFDRVGRVEIEFTGLPDVSAPVDPAVSDESIEPAGRLAEQRSSRADGILIGLVAVMIGVLCLLVVVESIGRIALQRIVGDEVRSAGVAVAADVTIGRAWWTPSVSRALLTGNLDRVDIDLRTTGVVGIPAESVQYTLSDLGVSISPWNRQVRITSLGLGSVTATVDPGSIADMLGVPVEISAGRLYIGGSREAASVSVLGTDLVIRDPQLMAITGSDAVTFPVSDPYMLPCDPSVELEGDRLVLACSGSELPGVVERAFGGGEDPADMSPDSGADVEIYAPGPIEAGD